MWWTDVRPFSYLKHQFLRLMFKQTFSFALAVAALSFVATTAQADPVDRRQLIRFIVSMDGRQP